MISPVETVKAYKDMFKNVEQRSYSSLGDLSFTFFLSIYYLKLCHPPSNLTILLLIKKLKLLIQALTTRENEGILI